MRRIAIAAGILAGLALMHPADGQASPQGKRIANLTPTPAQAFIVELNRALTARAKEFGMSVTGFYSPFDPALQAQQVDDAIAQKFDALAIVPVSEQAILPALARAKQAKIPVFLVNSPAKEGTEDLYVTWVGEDNTELGRIAARQVIKAIKESGRANGKVAAVTGSLQEGVAPRRVAGFKEVIGKEPTVELAAVEDAKWDTAMSERLAGQLIARFAPRGGLAAIYAMADNQSLGVIQGIEAAGKKAGLGKDDVIVVGSNCIKPTASLIRAGKLYSSGSQVPTRTGVRSAEVIADYFSGKSPPKTVNQPVEAITKENLDKWEKPCSF